MATIQQQTTQLEFHQAMADFKTMFPAMDDDVIEAVLRSNQGAVDATIDQLLSMSSDNENEKIRNELELDQMVEREQPDDSVIAIPKPPDLVDISGSTGKPAWNPPLIGPLPPDFLRLTPDPRQ
uniref:CUE domain-containing protein n=3 Tax=Rhodnius prolixus TaxID=13249 RepID=T1HUE5_RHOPR